jgi:hypothetical protein
MQAPVRSCTHILPWSALVAPRQTPGTIRRPLSARTTPDHVSAHPPPLARSPPARPSFLRRHRPPMSQCARGPLRQARCTRSGPRGTPHCARSCSASSISRASPGLRLPPCLEGCPPPPLAAGSLHERALDVDHEAVPACVGGEEVHIVRGAHCAHTCGARCGQARRRGATNQPYGHASSTPPPQTTQRPRTRRARSMGAGGRGAAAHGGPPYPPRSPT